jgi:transcription antitermination factor NusG
LRSLKLDVLLPRVESRRSRNRITQKAFFPNYLFTHTMPGGAEMDFVQNCQGVVRVVNSCGKPVPVESEIISSLQSMMDERGFVRLKEQPLERGTHIRIEQGHLRGWSGQIERELDGGRRVAILLDTILNARVIVDRLDISVQPEA